MNWFAVVAWEQPWECGDNPWVIGSPFCRLEELWLPHDAFSPVALLCTVVNAVDGHLFNIQTRCWPEVHCQFCRGELLLLKKGQFPYRRCWCIEMWVSRVVRTRSRSGCLYQSFLSMYHSFHIVSGSSSIINYDGNCFAHDDGCRWMSKKKNWFALLSKHLSS